MGLESQTSPAVSVNQTARVLLSFNLLCEEIEKSPVKAFGI